MSVAVQPIAAVIQPSVRAVADVYLAALVREVVEQAVLVVHQAQHLVDDV